MVIDLVPLIAIPLPILAHWVRIETGSSRSGVARYGSADWARMSDVERLTHLLSALALFAYVVLVSGRGDTPNALAAGALILFTARLAIDFYAGIRYPGKGRNT